MFRTCRCSGRAERAEREHSSQTALLHTQARVATICTDVATRLYTFADFRAARSNLRPNTGCAGLPFATVTAPMYELECAWTALQNLVMPAGIVPRCWLDAHSDHVHKPSKAPAKFDSYRELARSFAEGRLFEELLGSRVLPALKDAAQYYQDGLGDSLVANAASLDTHLCRKAQGLPSGDIFTDKREAFDRRQRDVTLADIADNTGLHPLDLVLMAESISRSTLRVCHEQILSTTIRPNIGILQGKTLSSAQYCVPAARAALRINATPGVGIGIDPAPRVVEAYLQSTDRTDADILDISEVRQWHQVAISGALSWEQIMQAASSDPIRLALVDTTATIFVGTRHYLDDQRTKIASRAQAAHTLAILKQNQQHQKT